MATARDYIDAAARYIGVSGTDNIFNTWIWGRHVYDPDTYPWCAAFQSYVGVHDLGMPFNPSASAAGVAWQGARVDDSDVQPGDWVLFNWDGRQDFGWADHIGLVEWFDHSNGYFGTIEGNCDDCVRRVTRYNYASYATAFFRPPYAAPEPPKPKEDPDLKRVMNKGGKVYRFYNKNDGNHMYAIDENERRELRKLGWKEEGVAFEAPRGGEWVVYRMYNPNNGDHLFTSDFGEASSLQLLGWIYEGSPFSSLDGSVPGKPVYRLRDGGGMHMLTASAEERSSLIRAGWADEGVAFTV